MKTWIRRSLLGAVAASIAFGGLAACGYRYDHHGWAGMTTEERTKLREKAIERVSSRLDLDAAQKQRLVVLADRLQEQRAAMWGTADPRAEVRNLIAGEKFDRAKAQTLVNQKTSAVNAGSPQVVAAFGDFYDGLNPAQQAKVREFLERRRHHGWWRS